MGFHAICRLPAETAAIEVPQFSGPNDYKSHLRTTTFWAAELESLTSHQWMYKTFCSFSEDYVSKLRLLKDPLNMKAAEKIIQFPYSAPVSSIAALPLSPHLTGYSKD